MEGFIVDRLAKKDVPKNSLEFILTEGIMESMLSLPPKARALPLKKGVTLVSRSCIILEY